MVIYGPVVYCITFPKNCVVAQKAATFFWPQASSRGQTYVYFRLVILPFLSQIFPYPRWDVFPNLSSVFPFSNWNIFLVLFGIFSSFLFYLELSTFSKYSIFLRICYFFITITNITIPSQSWNGGIPFLFIIFEKFTFFSNTHSMHDHVGTAVPGPLS